MSLNPAIKKRLLRTLIIVLIGVGIGALMGLQEMNARPQAKPSGLVGMKVGGPFSLTNQNGETVTDQSLKGQYKLIYFGFTSCAAVCPTELQKITRALNMLGAAGDKIQPVFITVDPERDTPAVMKDYVSLYHPRLMGLTGSPENIAATLKEFHIYAAKVQEPGSSDYTMDHSSFIYFMDGDDNLLGIYHSTDSAEAMAADMKAKLP